MRRKEQVHLDQLVGIDWDDGKELHKLGGEAAAFLAAMPWCRNVKNIYFDSGISKIAVFLCEIEGNGGYPFAWVVVGDVPPAYSFKGEIGLDVLRMYAEELSQWCEAVRAGSSTKNLTRVLERGSFRPLPETLEIADLVWSRVEFIRGKLIPFVEQQEEDFARDNAPG